VSSFAGSDYRSIYDDVDVISRFKPGWTLTEIRRMTVRQRRYWADYATWDLERRATLHG
jgi:hypothetical protein